LTAPPPRTDPDPALIRRATGGDPGALRALLETVAPAVQQWAMAVCRNQADAEDLTQDVLVLMIRKLPAFRGESRFLTWLYAVTRNQALDTLRRRERQERKMNHLKHHLPASGIHSQIPDRLLDGTRLRSLVSTFLGELPQRQREVFHMADMQGLSTNDISQILNIRPGAVRAALHKARKGIRRKILAHHPEFMEEYSP